MGDGELGDEVSDELITDHRETHLNMMACDHGEWELFSDDPYWMRRMEKIGIKPSKKAGDGYIYKLRADQVLIRAGKRAVSDEQRKKAAERMRLLNAIQAA